MNKIIGIAVLVVLLGGLVYFFGFRENEEAVLDEGMENSDPESYRGNLLALMGRGGNMRCTWESESEGVVSRGTVYMAGSATMRADYETEGEAGAMMTGHVIRSGDVVYAWSSEAPQGVKMTFSEEAFLGGGSATATEQQAVPANQEYEYNCSSWNPDQGVFTPPSDVEFMDMSAMMNASFEAMGGSAAMCAQCDAITDPNAKAQCRVALECQ